MIAMKKLFGQILLEKGIITETELEKGLGAQKAAGKKIGKQLVDLGLMREDDILSVLSEQFGLPVFVKKDYPAEPLIMNNLSLKFMRESQFVPLSLEENSLTIAIADPLDSYTIEAVRLATGLDIKLVIGKQDDITKTIEEFFGSEKASMEKIIEDIGKDEAGFAAEEEDIDHLRDLASEAPVIKLVNLIISRAIELRASDIHLEPFEGEFKTRYRIDGILHDAESPPKRLQPAIISRVKIMAKLNIAERRLPQDGRIKLRVAGKEIDFRVSTIPTLFGESVVMRILDQESVVLDLKLLGFPSHTLNRFESFILKPYGMILVTGPTGSGKTTSLYAALEKINSPEKKIITVEDPIEYQLRGINQIQVKPQIGLTFANSLRSIVRQDPDIILIGEIRDSETAEIAIQSALTGHLVFSTLHTNDAAGAITRLLEMGVEDYLLSSSLISVMAQRLVRVLCIHCKEAYFPEESILKEMGIDAEEGKEKEIFRAKGCEECAHTGYKGRTGIYELLPINEQIKNLILSQSDAGAIKKAAVKTGMTTLRQDGWEKVRKGITSISEVLRVTLEE